MSTKLIHGDCLNEMSKMDDKSVDIIIADPPYGMDFQSNHRQKKHQKIQNDDKFPLWIFDEFNRIARNAVYIFCRWDNLHEMPKPKSVLVWVKNNWSMGDLQHEHGRQWEAICFYPQEKHEFIKRIPDVIHANRTGNNLHPTEKPVELIKELLAANVGQSVLDPFMGSGTTAIACKEMERDFIGIEIDEVHFKTAKERVDASVDSLFNF